ncbi:MAG: sigma-54 dependent transcriptional regulator [Pseudomonadota bacterium]
MSEPSALVIDDEPDICELLSLTLGRMGIHTESALDLETGKQKLKNHDFDLCLTDMRLPDGDGLELVEWMQQNTPNVPVAVITAHGNIETAVNALKLGAFDFLSKPLDLNHLRNIIESALKLDEPDDSQRSSLLGKSQAMADLRDMIDKVARSQAPVHIFGESGTGKELVARLIHESSPRGDGAFVPVNCGAIPSELMESEFFGHKKGSFTGADSDKTGLIQSAEGGTLFLDEIADLPLAMQVKLLRVIQEKTVRPVGSSREEAVNARILSATHKNLRQMVTDGDFREDLFYRINVIELAVPALRERGDDTIELAHFILRKLGSEVELDESARNALLRYDFPGNVRELENMLERAVTLCTSGVVSEADLNLRSPDSSGDAGGVKLTGKLGDQLEDVQRQAIIDALEKTRYNKTAAAKLLGLSFRQLRYRIAKLGIE